VVDNDELYEYDASDELVAMNSTRFRWDRVGQLVEKDDPAQANPTRYEWNAAHRLARVTLPDLTSAEYRYNGDELRTWRREPSGAETNYYWVPSGILGLSQVLNETDGTGDPKANYVLGPNGLIALIDGDVHERYYVFDALGSVLALTDEAGFPTDVYYYDEYGRPTSANESGVYNPVRYASYCFDQDTRLYYLRERYYCPSIGTFIVRDPASNSAWPFVRTLYEYAINNPENLFDPTGRTAALPATIAIELALLALIVLAMASSANMASNDSTRQGIENLVDNAREHLAKLPEMIYDSSVVREIGAFIKNARKMAKKLGRKEREKWEKELEKLEDLLNDHCKGDK
jgi:RHS repeat-associated protein